ncbi:MAG: prolyl oligopeptidase family serine peptidase [Acidobacteriota bacterium]
MKSTFWISRSALLLIALCASACSDAGAPSAPPIDGKALTLERLYSQPNLIGTAPTAPVWSPDGQRLAFLWNDEGLNFRSAWVVDTDAPDAPERWTELEAPSAAEIDDPYAAAVEAERVEREPGITSLQWHPDGERLVFARRASWFVAAKGAEPQPLVDGARNVTFSPNGERLAFLRSGEVWVAAAAGSGARQLTSLSADGVGVASFRWAPSGDRLAVVVDDRSEVTERLIPDYLSEETSVTPIRRAYLGEAVPTQSVAVVALTGAATKLSLAQPEPPLVSSVRWSPDGEHLAVDTSDLYAKDRRLFRVDPNGREPSQLLAQDADDENETLYFWRAEWATDGESVFFLSDRETDFHVWAAPREGGDAVAWTSGEGAVAEFWPTAEGLFYVGHRGVAEERHLFFVGAPGEEPVKVTQSSGTHAPVVAPGGEWAASAFSADDTPPDLLLTEVESAREVRVTDSPLAEFDDYAWATPEYVTFTSHVDGTTLHGRLTVPPGLDRSKGRVPAILGSVYTDSVRNQWGGRTAHPTWGLDQYLVQQGYVLLNVDMRGSWGRGREHRRGIRLDYGGMDIEDLESGVRYLESLGFVDMDRVGLWGSSYGGLMTSMSLFRKPGLYAAGIAGAPATNVWHALPAQMTVMMRPQDQPEEYADSSPFLHGHGLEDPLMIIHGMRDRVVLYKDSLTLVQRLLQMDKDVELVTLPNAGHGWDNEGLAQTRFAFRRMVDFFDRHLKGEAE